MTQFRCPHCHTQLPLETLTEDACARQLWALLSEAGLAAGPLVSYLMLFKPRTQALRWSRALVLAQEVLGFSETTSRLTLSRALVETVDKQRDKRRAPTWKPFTGHNYLRRVLESMTDSEPPPARGETSGPVTRTGQALLELERFKRGE